MVSSYALCGAPVIGLFTDFGAAGPYTGQIRSVLAAAVPDARVIDVLSDTPPFDVVSASALLAAYAGPPYPPGSVFVCVIDPGVGGARDIVVVLTDRGWFVGPDNGLFTEIIAICAPQSVRVWRALWRPETLSDSFHGRDVMAPVAASLFRGETPMADAPAFREISPDALVTLSTPRDAARIVYIDRYGNALSHLRASDIAEESLFIRRGLTIGRARTFCDTAPGTVFWYVNSNGLIEFAVCQGRADEALSVGPGDVILKKNS